MLERHAEAFRALVLELCHPHRAAPPDPLVAIESCGYLFGAPMAFELDCPLGRGATATLTRVHAGHARRSDGRAGLACPAWPAEGIGMARPQVSARTRSMKPAKPSVAGS